MPLKVWNGSSWAAANRLKVWNGSSWVDCTYGNVWNGSSWVQFYTGYTANLVSGTYTRLVVSPASLQINADGYVYASSGTTQLVQQYQWQTGIGSAGDYQVYATLTSGTTPSGSALNTWLTLSSSVQWNITATLGNARLSTLDVSIRLTAAPNTVLAGPTSITIECDRT